MHGEKLHPKIYERHDNTQIVFVTPLCISQPLNAITPKGTALNFDTRVSEAAYNNLLMTR